MKRTGYIARKTPIKRGGRIVPKKRSAAEKARIYGGNDRITWMKRQPCLIAEQHQCVGAIQGHHIVNGGMGRKADHALTVPLCVGAHTLLHAIGSAAWMLTFSVNLVTAAADTQARWQAECARRGVSL